MTAAAYRCASPARLNGRHPLRLANGRGRYRDQPRRLVAMKPSLPGPPIEPAQNHSEKTRWHNPSRADIPQPTTRDQRLAQADRPGKPAESPGSTSRRAQKAELQHLGCKSTIAAA